MISELVIIFVALIWNTSNGPTSTWGAKAQTQHTSQDVTTLSRTGMPLLSRMVYSCCYSPAWKVAFCNKNLQQNSINTNKSFSDKRNSIWTQAQTFVYKHVSAAFSHYQETYVVKMLHIHFSNPSLPSGHKPYLLASCKDPTLGSDPIYSSSGSNTVKTTRPYNEDMASLHVEANIFRHN